MIMAIVAVSPLLPMIRDEINATYSQISIFVASLGVIRLLCAFPGGYFADHFDRRKILVLSGLTCILGLVVMSFAQSLFQLIVSRILIGASSIVANITILVILSQISSPKGKGAMMSMNNVVHNAGGIITPGLVGILAARYDWRLPFILIAVFILIATVVTAFSFEDESLKQTQTKNSGPGGSETFRIRRIISEVARFWPIFTISLFVFFFRGSFRHTLVPFYGRDILNIGVERLGLYISAMGFVSMFSVFAFGYLSDRYGRKFSLVCGLLFSTSAVAALLLPARMNPLLLACICVGMGATINSMPNILISDHVSASVVGKMIGINRVFADSGYFIGSILTGALLDYLGFGFALVTVLIYAALSLGLAVVSVHNKPKTEHIEK